MPDDEAPARFHHDDLRPADGRRAARAAQARRTWSHSPATTSSSRSAWSRRRRGSAQRGSRAHSTSTAATSATRCRRGARRPSGSRLPGGAGRRTFARRRPPCARAAAAAAAAARDLGSVRVEIFESREEGPGESAARRARRAAVGRRRGMKGKKFWRRASARRDRRGRVRDTNRLSPNARRWVNVSARPLAVMSAYNTAAVLQLRGVPGAGFAERRRAPRPHPRRTTTTRLAPQAAARRRGAHPSGDRVPAVTRGARPCGREE